MPLHLVLIGRTVDPASFLPTIDRKAAAFDAHSGRQDKISGHGEARAIALRDMRKSRQRAASEAPHADSEAL